MKGDKDFSKASTNVLKILKSSKGVWWMFQIFLKEVSRVYEDWMVYWYTFKGNSREFQEYLKRSSKGV